MDAILAATIKGELWKFVGAAGTRRFLPTTCHVGQPGGERVRLAHQDFTRTDLEDASFRADLVERAIDGLLTTAGACAWVTRSGELDLVDADAEWFAAVRAAFARHGLRLPAFFVLNRRGWVDLVSGEQRQWSRIRNR